jgi:hypothetical protein
MEPISSVFQHCSFPLRQNCAQHFFELYCIYNSPSSIMIVKIVPTNYIPNAIEGVLHLLTIHKPKINKTNNTSHCASMTANTELKCEGNPKSKERIFFLYEECLWTMTSLDKSHLDDIIGKESTCPMCFQDQLSSFPIILNDSFT